MLPPHVRPLAFIRRRTQRRTARGRSSRWTRGYFARRHGGEETREGDLRRDPFVYRRAYTPAPPRFSWSQSFAEIVSRGSAGLRMRGGKDLVRMTARTFSSSPSLLRQLSVRDLVRLVWSCAVSIDSASTVRGEGEGSARRRATFLEVRKRVIVPRCPLCPHLMATNLVAARSSGHRAG